MVLGILLGSYLHYHSAAATGWSPICSLRRVISSSIDQNDCCADCDLHAGGGYRGCGDAKQLGRIGAKTIIYFEVTPPSPSFWGSLWRTYSSPVPGGYVAAGDRRYLEISEHYGRVQSSSHGIMGTILSLVPTNTWRRWRKAKCCRSSSSRCCLSGAFIPARDAS